MASGSKPRWRDRLRNLKPSTSTSQRSHKSGQAALKSVLGTLQSSLGQLPSLQLAVGGLLECIINLEIAEQNRQAYDEIISDLTRLASLLQRHVVESNPQNMAAINEQTECIKRQQDRSRISRLALVKEDEEAVLGCYQRVNALFQQLQADVSLSIWDAIRGQQMDTRLKDLLPAHDAYYNAALPATVTKRGGCTKNTRVEILKAICEWARGIDVPPIYWMNGMAGTGKTTIAYTICKILHENRQLGASFFCSRNSPDCRNVNKIVPTIAYQLGRYSKPYQKALYDVLNSDPDVAKRDIRTQFEQLISKPLSAMGNAMPDGVVLVIDALDECNDIGGTRTVLNLLLQYANNLPIGFFVASRPEPAISNRMAAPGGAMRSILRLHDIEQSLVQADIKTYLTETLESIGVTPSEIDQLAARAGSLFIFAATAVRYILPDMDSVDHGERLLTVLGLQSTQRNTRFQDINELYNVILSNALDDNKFDHLELARRQQTLWTVVCAREPLTITALAELLDMPNSWTVQLAIHPLQSVLHVSESTQVVSTFHASFPDFLLDKERAGRFHCDEALQSAFLAGCCFRVMERSLRFNICEIESSHQLDREVPDLQNRIDDAISRALFYSCIYWGDHIIQGPFSSPLLPSLESFIRHRLLFWLEVLNLGGQLGRGDGVLAQALAWLPTESKTFELRDLIQDTRSFVITLASHPISLSTPHIYISGLPFASRQSHVWANYYQKTRGLISVDGAVLEARGRPILVTWKVGGTVHGIAQSSDGKLVASGSESLEYGERMSLKHRGELRIWDASSGICILGPFKDYGVTICSLAFSPDDARLASGSSDGAVRIWDVNKGDLITGSLRSHTSAVNSIAFSPNGNLLASGSGDRTIRLWDAFTCTSLGKPLQGHKGAINSLAFSPDVKHLASGSSDGTIRIWDLQAGTTVQELIEGHTAAVHSIAYSHDGRCLVSGSMDCNVRVWNVLDGTLLVSPFQGHTKAVKSVSFSPDSTRVVSGSDDKTIRVWETMSGRLLAGPFEGHYAGVNSVLFSVDGTRILSGSSDKTICVWDPRYGKTVTTKSEGHTGVIYSVSSSLDGRLIASGSSDGVICVWDTRSGTLVAGPFRGHTGEVRSVAFSPDGARIVSGSDDFTLRTWDVSTGALLVGPIEGHTNVVRAVTFSPNGSQIASSFGDRTIRLWDSHTGQSVSEPFRGHTGGVTSIAFPPDGSRIVSGSYACEGSDHTSNDKSYNLHSSTIQMWLASDSTVPLWTSDAHTQDVNCVMFSPDGTRVVSGSCYDCSILVLDAYDGAVLHGPFMGHTDSVYSVAFSPNGAHVVSGSRDRTVRMWDVESGTTVVGPLEGHSDRATSVTFSPDGAHIISGSADGTIRIWDVAASVHASTTLSDDWFIDDNGWLTDSKSQRLLWVPSDLRRRFGFLTPSNPVVINADCTARIEDTTLLGDRWRECYVVSPDPVLS